MTDLERRDRQMVQWRLVARRVRRMGVLQLWRHRNTDRWCVTLDNRTYHGHHEIAPAKLDLWWKEFGLVARSSKAEQSPYKRPTSGSTPPAPRTT